ncbi:transcriptional regulator [Nocardioides sp. OK12]|nr:transcriptional regulator [Nocardioides sp. OK12]
MELSRRTGLSSSAVSTLTAELIDAGVVEEDPAPPVSQGRGRPAHRLRVRPPEGLVVGVDLGNTHVRVAATDVGGPVLAEEVEPLRGADSMSRTLDLTAALVRRVVASTGRPQAEVRLVALGLPAPLAHATGTVADNNILSDWVGRQPGDELAERLAVDVVVENDANLGALGEHRAGVGAGSDSLVYVKFSTGIGAGLVLGGRLFRGVGGTAGEVGHVQVEPAGQLCRCGSRGCLETVVSLPRLVDALAPVTERDLDPSGLSSLVAAGHPGAVRVVTDAGRTVGRALASLVTVLNPDLLVVGGRWDPVNALLADRIGGAVEEWSQPSAASQVRVCAATCGERAEVLGALALACDLVTRREREATMGG